MIIYAENMRELHESLLPKLFQLIQLVDDLVYQLDLFVLQLVSLRDLSVQNIIELLFLGKQRLCASHVLVVFLEEKVPDAILYLIQIAAYLHDLDVKLVKLKSIAE